jgi:mono/diheme cytochrome c family protein
LAAIGTVVTMLFLFFKLPNNSHPVHDTDYMKKVSSDKYGLLIEADDELFNEAEVKKFFEELGAAEVLEIYWDEEEVNASPKIFEPKFIGFLVVVSIIVSGTLYVTWNKLMYMTPYNWMMDQDKELPQQNSTVFANGTSMQMPIEGTISRGSLPYPYKGQPELAAKNLVNPLDFTEENLDLGKKKFTIYCSPCHGNFGEGDSRLRGQFPNPPSLHSEKVRGWSDGRIFHVITEGQNVMPSYSSQLSREEKWATILYIRALQRALNAKESDL